MTVSQYDPIQVQDHEPLNVGNSAIFKGCLLPHFNGVWQMTTDSQIRGQYTYSLSGPDLKKKFP